MGTFLIVAAIVQNVAISLGVGTSTMAIINFFAAIADGKIDETERRMMGLVYYVLRIAMVAILLSLIAQFSIEVQKTGTLVLSTGTVSIIILVSILYINAILMTARKMPSSIGPALQAGTWYSLGLLATLTSLGLVSFGLLELLSAYITIVIFMIMAVNAMMAYLKGRHTPRT